MLDTEPFAHGRTESPILYMDKSVRVGKWLNMFNETRYME